MTTGDPRLRMGLARVLGAIERAVWRLCGPRTALGPLLPVLTPVLERMRRAHWNALWRIESSRPASELSTAVPKELMEAVTSGWIAPGSSIMDIGAGRGQVSAWLADRGFHVLGVDISAEAMALARRHFTGAGAALEFRALDICETPPEAARFDGLLDRGCFHGIPDALRSRYAANIAGWAKPGARFLLLAKLDGPAERVIAGIRGLFDPYFDIIRTAPTVLSRSAGPLPRIERPGLVVWMVRRAAAGPSSSRSTP